MPDFLRLLRRVFFSLKFHFYRYYDTIVLFTDYSFRLFACSAMDCSDCPSSSANVSVCIEKPQPANLFLSRIYLAIESKYFAQGRWLFRKSNSLTFKRFYNSRRRIRGKFSSTHRILNRILPRIEELISRSL